MSELRFVFGMRGVRGLHRCFALGVCLALGVACSKTTDHGVLQDADFAAPKGSEAKFDKNIIVDTAAFTDVDGLDGTIIQKFLHKTAYDRASFLETYQSNGVRASDAIARAARTYRINPLVFLVEAQTSEGLLGEPEYPFPPERVEYVFRCGCLQGNNCLPELAGFDRQVDCLGRKLRVALDQIAQAEVTAAGWGKDKTSTTLDNQKVTPTTEATAVVYDYTPRVAEGSAGGAWLFWNVWNLYAAGIDYAGPIGGPGAAGWIGDKCVSNAGCGVEGATCATNFTGGLCTIGCKGDCPSQPDKPESFCADFRANGGFCLNVCNPGAPACRDGYVCARLKRFGATDNADSKYVCTLP
jgi:hypothetical protein